MDGQTDRPTEERPMDGRTNGPTDRRTHGPLDGNGKEVNYANQKNTTITHFCRKTSKFNKSDFANQFFNFLQECVQKGVYFGAYMAPIFAYSLKVVPRSQIAWNKENSIKPSSLEAKLTVFGI